MINEVMSPLFNHNGFDILHDHLIEGISVAEKPAATALIDQTSSYTGHVCQTAVATTPSLPVRDSQRSLCGYCGLDLSSLDASVQLPTAAYHFGCFRCNKCRTALSLYTFRVKDGMVYCGENCYTDVADEWSVTNATEKTETLLQFIPMNRKQVSDEYVEKIDRTCVCARCHRACCLPDMIERAGCCYHKCCIRCTICNKLLDVSTAKWMEIAPYCEEHYAECEKPRYEAKLSPPVKTTKRTFVVQNFKPSIKNDSNMSRSESSLNMRPASANPILQTKISGYSPPPRHRMLRLSQRNSIESESDISDVKNTLSSFTRTPHTQSNLQLNRQSPNVAHFHRDDTPSRLVIEHQCFACGRSVPTADQVNYSSRIYHTDCARCKQCRCKPNGQKLYLLQGILYCRLHYKERKEAANKNENGIMSKDGKIDHISFDQDMSKSQLVKRVELVVQPTSTWRGHRDSLPEPPTESWPRRGILRSSE